MKRLGEMIRLWREANRYGTREMAKIIGITASTLNRIENGEDMNGRTYLKIVAWFSQ